MDTRARMLLAGLVLAALTTPSGAVAAAPRGLCGTIVARDGGTQYLAVFSAFPAELAPLVARATVRERVEIDGRPFYLGELAGIRVILGLLGIGMVNAATTAESVLSHFDVAGVVVSGVAGSTHRIGEVTVPKRWVERDTGSIFPTNPALFQLARRIARGVTLERCTDAPPPVGMTVCMPFEPLIYTGGVGLSGDPLNGAKFPCLADGGEIYGCDLPLPAVRVAARAAEEPETPVAEDEETAAVCRVASARGIPWVAFRAASDGPGDPHGLPGFPTQFLAYYRLAAVNAAAGTLALLDRMSRLEGTRRAESPVCRLLAKGRWNGAARLLRPHRSSTRPGPY